MGVARVECRSGCKCDPSRIDGTWRDQVSLQQIHMFRVRGRGRAGLGVRQVGKPAGAQACRLPRRQAGWRAAGRPGGQTGPAAMYLPRLPAPGPTQLPHPQPHTTQAPPPPHPACAGVPAPQVRGARDHHRGAGRGQVRRAQGGAAGRTRASRAPLLRGIETCLGRSTPTRRALLPAVCPQQRCCRVQNPYVSGRRPGAPSPLPLPFPSCLPFRCR